MQSSSPFVLIFAVLLVAVPAAFAAHPLVTDDSGTQGTGRVQFELTGERAHESAEKDTTIEAFVVPTLTYGVTDSLDLAISVPWLKRDLNAAGEKTSVSGMSDTVLAAKWRFAEYDGLSLAMKPVITFPTGDETQGLGTGKSSYGLFLIGTKEAKPFAVHANVGYVQSNRSLDERHDIWQVSLAAEYSPVDSLRVAVDVGQRKNEDRTSVTHPAYVLVGVIYALTENIDLDIGYKWRLNAIGPDSTIMAGITMRFGGGGDSAAKEVSSAGKDAAIDKKKKTADERVEEAAAAAATSDSATNKAAAVAVHRHDGVSADAGRQQLMEFIFNQGTGDIFVVRTAGNVANDMVIGSIDTPLSISARA